MAQVEVFSKPMVHFKLNNIDTLMKHLVNMKIFSHFGIDFHSLSVAIWDHATCAKMWLSSIYIPSQWLIPEPPGLLDSLDSEWFNSSSDQH